MLGWECIIPWTIYRTTYLRTILSFNDCLCQICLISYYQDQFKLKIDTPPSFLLCSNILFQTFTTERPWYEAENYGLELGKVRITARGFRKWICQSFWNIFIATAQSLKIDLTTFSTPHRYLPNDTSMYVSVFRQLTTHFFFHFKKILKKNINKNY